MRSLADLIPFLGSTTVIGGQRAKLFNDGRPINHPIKNTKTNRKNSNPVSVESAAVQPTTLPDIDVGPNQALSLPERPRPDGEEVDTSTEEVEQSAEEDLDNWEDWDVNETISRNLMQTVTTESVDNLESSQSHTDNSESSSGGVSSLENMSKKRSLPDILELDIKNQSGSVNGAKEVDFFQDMEPVIESSTKYLVSEDKSEEEGSDGLYAKNNNLGVANSELNEDGWGDEEWD